MQQMMMTGFILLIYGGMTAAVVFLLMLLSRFVKASERTACATEEIARKLRDDTKT